MKNYKDKQINLCWTPFGYSYSVPLSLGYLKSNLTDNEYTNVKVMDFNQDFWYRNKDELGKGLNPFEERNIEEMTPKDNKPPLLVSTKSSIVFLVILNIFSGIMFCKKINIFSESISGIQALIYGNNVKRNMIRGKEAIVKLNATANDLSKISSSLSFVLNILNTL